MLKRIIIVFLLFAITLSCRQVFAQDTNQGHLFIIGGRKLPSLMKKFVQLAGGPQARIIIFPMASEDPLNAALYQRHQFELMGVKNVEFIICDSVSANADSNLSVLQDATGIFFSGGDQSNLTKALINTKMLEQIKQIYKNGGIIGGNSAGAAVMSEMMITGDELINTDSTRAFITIQKNNIKVTEGFGFLKSAIIDQHFVRRKRHNRLISLVLEHPELIGIAIDEATAIIFSPDNTFEVLGDYTVIVYDATEASRITTDKKGNLSAANIRMHVLKSGDKYDLKTREVK
jgi:cyanophycinase